MTTTPFWMSHRRFRRTCFSTYVDDTYKPVVLPLMAKSTQGRYEGIINNYLIPAFGQMCLRELSPLTMVDERCTRGDWSTPKSKCSSAPVGVPLEVIRRIHALKNKVVEVRAGRAVRKYACVKSDLPEDLVFQSVQDGRPMRDNNILTRKIKPAALGLGFVNWRCLRTSCATWLKKAGADPKDIQGHLRHSRVGTTMDIYVQDVPESRRRAVEQLPIRHVM